MTPSEMEGESKVSKAPRGTKDTTSKDKNKLDSKKKEPQWSLQDELTN